MSPWHALMRFEELPDDDTGEACVVDGRRVAVFRKGEDVVAFDDECPHMGASLGVGVLKDGEVTCPWHSFHFDVCTGRNTDGLSEAIDVYESRVASDGRVEVHLPARADVASEPPAT